MFFEQNVNNQIKLHFKVHYVHVGLGVQILIVYV